MLVTAYNAFATEVRRYDPHRLITTGDAMPRDSAWHNRHERNWTKDSPAQFDAMIALLNPNPINLISVHCYDANLARW